MRSSYKKVRVSDIGVALIIDGSNCTVTAVNIQNDVEIKSSYKDINVEQVGGSLDIDGSNCRVAISDVKKNADIRASYKSVSVKDLGGSLKVNGSNSSVLVDGLGGDADIVNSYKQVILKRTGGSIKVRGQNSSIEVYAIEKLPKESQIELITSYKAVTLSLPEAANVTISAYTSYGKIRSDYPVYLNEDSNKQQARVELGDGSTLVRIETSGNITLRKE
ncbi:hypothetical protein IH799_06020 [candidate division KSB1 bacterium]|nr:hypothetical protein [candidate division KSB1 bacterium]